MSDAPFSVSAAAQALGPAVVDPVCDLVQAVQARLQVLLDLRRGLDGRTFLMLLDLLRSGAEPGAHQLGGHLDVALHAEVLAERERLVRAVRTLEDARPPWRDAEGLAMPVERFERLHGAEPLAGNAVVCDLHLAPADL